MDGVILNGHSTMEYPALWEAKSIQSKDWKLLVKNKVKTKYLTYYTQIQIYQKYFNLTKNPAIFSAINRDSLEIYWEKINYDPDFMVLIDAKMKRILNACEAGELLPRMSQDPNFYICKHFCSYGKRCFKDA